MSRELPKGWRTGRLKDLCEDVERRLGAGTKLEVLSVTKRGVIPQSETYDKEIASEDVSKYRVIHPGEFGMAPMALYYGAIGRYHGDRPAIISPTYNVFKNKSDADPNFLEALLRLPRMISRYDALSQGGNLEGKRKLTPYEAFETVKVLIPPYAEQQAIAEILRMVDNVIVKTEELNRQLRATTECITETLCLVINPSTGERHLLHWRPSTINEEMVSVQVGIVVKPASYYVNSGGIPALRSLNVKENRIYIGDLVNISEVGHNINAKSALRPGDVVTVRSGEPGTTAVVPKDAPELNCIDIIFSRPKPQVRSEFVSYCMNSRLARRQVSVLQGGLAQQHLNVSEMKRIKILVPPMTEQDRIVSILREMWQRIEIEDVGLKQLRAVRAALAQELLSGRLPIPAIITSRLSGAGSSRAA